MTLAGFPPCLDEENSMGWGLGEDVALEWGGGAPEDSASRNWRSSGSQAKGLGLLQEV